ncbi:alpha/beta fold hydrolase [Streptomyces sp. NPDC126510]|uniref:alpha/beta fold hydrolase n=1 Tax=Streptomyces sp. NPDC126510 TaxID=3155317 RepID=UPI0033268916
MSDFVMVAGTWLGAWAWDEVAEELRGAGHTVHAVTLSGLAERRNTQPAGQRTHVRDIVEEVERLDLGDVVLVGHSYAGIPVGQAAERIGDRLRRVVFVDGNVPVDGESFLSGWPSDHVRRAIDGHDGHAGYWPPLGPEDYAGQGLTDQQIARIVGGSTPHPGMTLTEPAILAGPLDALPATYVKCLLDGDEPMPAVAALLKSDSWELVTLDTGHWPMFSQPSALARVLHAAARP